MGPGFRRDSESISYEFLISVGILAQICMLHPPYELSTVRRRP
jgi:hypothetical protein